MKELSLNVLDIACNSVKAGADKIDILLTENEEELTISISDNGCGMKADFLEDVANPFRTTRTTRKVGLGIPLFKMAALQTDGEFSITSKHKDEFPEEHGTQTVATFRKGHIDFTPLGDIVSTVTVLIQGSPLIRWCFCHKTEKGQVSLDTDELKAVLGAVPLDNYEVINWISEYLKEQYNEIGY
ncbi:MAG: sensor histidine kinase [Clostridia bacterium]|nr:sensor histidine kinase [Clostridia bacterium]MBR3975399.1 sensor histidine kinase [Clostridia bacterium]MDO4420405.1 ATP-binding protein [Ruminococcus sp.]